MNKMISLTKVFLKNSFQFNYNKKRIDSSTSKSKKIILAIGVAILALYLAAIIGGASYGLITVLLEINQAGLFVGLYLLLIIFFILFQTIFSSINIFYFSKDINYVLPLPVKPYEILMAKFNVLLIGEYFIEAILGIVPLIVYGVLTGASYMFYIYGIIVFLLLPILPVILAAFLIMIIMSFAKLTKYRDKFQVIVGIVAIGIAIGVQFLINGNVSMSQEQLIEMITKVNGLAEIISKYFITIEPAMNVLLNPNTFDAIINVFKIIGITAIAYFAFLAIGQKIYLRGAIGNTSNASKKNKMIKSDKVYVLKNILFRYVGKEFKILFRNPIYFMQCVLPAILVPVLMIVSTLFTYTGEGSIYGEIKNISLYNSIAVCVVLAMIQFLLAMNFSVITAFSREGQNATFSKYIPVSLYNQYIYKMIPGIMLNGLTIIVVLVTCKLLYINTSIFYLLGLFLASTLLSIIQCYFMLMVDLKRPKLYWDSEYAVVKQNINMIFQFFLMFVITGILGGITYLMRDVNYIVYLSTIAILGVTIWIFIDRYVRKNINKLFEKIV